LKIEVGPFIVNTRSTKGIKYRYTLQGAKDPRSLSEFGQRQFQVP
jgi:hypothetical protein